MNLENATVVLGGLELDVNGFPVRFQPILHEGLKMHAVLVVGWEATNSSIL